jgi:AraC family L-rhamnose operon regulatory protein RhaS
VTELRTEWESGAPAATLLVPGLFLRLLIHLSRCHAAQDVAVAPGKNASRHEATVATAVRYLDQHFAEPVRMEHVAATVFLSVDRFTDVFLATMGRTPFDYLRHLRLEHAKSLLLSSNGSIMEIAQQCGFHSAAHFSHMFRESVGLSPSTFRKTLSQT